MESANPVCIMFEFYKAKSFERGNNMCCTPQINLNNKQSKKRLVVLAFLLCFIVVSMLSQAFILTHADHAHDNNGVGGGCATCAQIQSAENLLKQLGTAVINAAAAFTGLFTVIAIIQSAFSDITLLTPVTLKIRMNN